MGIQEIKQQIEQCMLRDAHRFRRRLQHIKRKKPLDQEKLLALAADVQRSVNVVTLRKDNVPTVSFPDALPIAQKSEQIKQAIQENQVIILCGETGSGKTTQLPKICLDLGLGVRGKIGHTQPRRLAARSVAQRIADEMQTELGKEVGYKVRFSDQSNDNSYIKLMTDGILLAECHHDPYLNQYDTIIIDEAHERSLNIDFLLGYLKRLIKRRKDLKLIITSATIDPERFATHFENAPVINVSGRTYPVEVRYRPYLSAESENRKNLQDGIIDAVFELSQLGRGDILVFLSGERDIRETADALNKIKDNRVMSNTEVLPLLARLSNAEQNRIFNTSSKRRIVLATNVAETSLTVPGIKYVIDSGVARISRYSWRSKIQRLPIEKISQASANQRKGRCGRVSEGICIRLYDEEDFEQRAEFTEPEIKRTNLAAVILQMENLNLGQIDEFPFVEPPEERLINDGYKLLNELGAITGDNYSGYNITKTGKQLARFPIDPKLARMLIEASRENALTEMLIIVSALATQDPRERPLDKQQAADEKHAAFKEKSSDFIAYVNLWNAYHKEKKATSGNQLRKWCKKNFISWMRMREWIDTRRQIEGMLAEQNLIFNRAAASFDQIHRSALIGLLANVGYKDENKTYLGARNKKFTVFPGSALYKSPPKWIMSAEIVETSQIYARTNAKIDVKWLEQKAGHLLKHHYKNPHWEKKRSQVVATQQSTLYGLMVVTDKKVNYGRIDAVLSKEIFIRSALVACDIDSKAGFYQHNKNLIASLEAQEAKSRRRDILVDEEVLYDFYDKHLPDDIVSGQSLDKWLKNNKDKASKLFLKKDDLVREEAVMASDSLFPDVLSFGGSKFPLEYHFDPSNHCDGVTLVTPLAGLSAVNAQRCEWLIPGLLLEKITAIIRSLPKQIRKNFVPAPNYANACIEALEPSDTSLYTAISAHLFKMTGVQVPYEVWQEADIDNHLLMNYRVIDAQGNTLETGRNLQRIKDQLADTVEDEDVSVDDSAYGVDDVGVDAIDELTDSVELNLQGLKIEAYPALKVDGKHVNLVALENKVNAEKETTLAIAQLYSRALGDQIKDLMAQIKNQNNLCLKYKDFGDCYSLQRDLVNRSIAEVFEVTSIHSSQVFKERLASNANKLKPCVEQWLQLVTTILDGYREVKKRLAKPTLAQLDMVADIQLQLNTLMAKGFVSDTDGEWLQQYPRYLKAINKRLDKSSDNVMRDKQLRLAFAKHWEAYSKRKTSLEANHIESSQIVYYRWLLEEFRVSLFAQELKTRVPVSEKRLKTYWNNMSDI